MAFANIEDLLKSKNPQAAAPTPQPDPNAPVDPNDPNAPKDPNAPDAEPQSLIKPFGDLEVDPLTGHPVFGSGKASSGHRGTLGDTHMRHKAIILKRSFEDGKVKLYEDARGLAEKTDIQADGGTVVVYKDYDYPGGLSRYKKIEIFSPDQELLGAINMYPRNKDDLKPVYRFFYERAEVGTGNGDIALFVAQALVGRNIQARSGAGTSIDNEIITTIKRILQIKR